MGNENEHAEDLRSQLRSLNDIRSSIRDNSDPQQSLSTAISFWLYWPMHLNIGIGSLGVDGQVLGDESKVRAFDRRNISAVHEEAEQRLAFEAIDLGLPSKALHLSGGCIRRIINSGKPILGENAVAASWPEVLGERWNELPRSERDAIDDGQAEFRQIAAHIDRAKYKTPRESALCDRENKGPPIHEGNFSSYEPKDKEQDATREKVSTAPGEAEAKIIAALTAHHKYDNGSCLCQDPIGSNELARLASVSNGSTSAFFKRQFDGYDKYRNACKQPGMLSAALKALNREYQPRDFLRFTVRDDLDAEASE